MAGNVNLDALIKREDMASGEFKTTKALKDINHTELELSKNTYSVLRKPDFQRETAMWTPEKVRDLIIAYAEEDLVPAIILWRSPFNDLFVIDGAHRLSSLIAWVNDDYGDGITSTAFFGEIPKIQKEAAQKARELVNEVVGPYKVISEAFKSHNTPAIYVERAKRLVNCFVPIQQLETPDIAKAERSFFKINEQGVPLTATEITLLHSRNCPNAIAARAINQRGTAIRTGRNSRNRSGTKLKDSQNGFTTVSSLQHSPAVRLKPRRCRSVADIRPPRVSVYFLTG
jgi:hypothetical protein